MSERASDCDICHEPIPFGTLCWMRHKGRDAESNLPVVVLLCDACHEENPQ